MTKIFSFNMIIFYLLSSQLWALGVATHMPRLTHQTIHQVHTKIAHNIDRIRLSKQDKKLWEKAAKTLNMDLIRYYFRHNKVFREGLFSAIIESNKHDGAWLFKDDDTQVALSNTVIQNTLKQMNITCHPSHFLVTILFGEDLASCLSEDWDAILRFYILDYYFRVEKSLFFGSVNLQDMETPQFSKLGPLTTILRQGHITSVDVEEFIKKQFPYNKQITVDGVIDELVFHGYMEQQEPDPDQHEIQSPNKKKSKGVYIPTAKIAKLHGINDLAIHKRFGPAKPAILAMLKVAGTGQYTQALSSDKPKTMLETLKGCGYLGHLCQQLWHKHMQEQLQFFHQQRWRKDRKMYERFLKKNRTQLLDNITNTDGLADRQLFIGSNAFLLAIQNVAPMTVTQYSLMPNRDLLLATALYPYDFQKHPEIITQMLFGQDDMAHRIPSAVKLMFPAHIMHPNFNNKTLLNLFIHLFRERKADNPNTPFLDGIDDFNVESYISKKICNDSKQRRQLGNMLLFLKNEEQPFRLLLSAIYGIGKEWAFPQQRHFPAITPYEETLFVLLVHQHRLDLSKEDTSQDLYEKSKAAHKRMSVLYPCLFDADPSDKSGKLPLYAPFIDKFFWANADRISIWANPDHQKDDQQNLLLTGQYKKNLLALAWGAKKVCERNQAMTMLRIPLTDIHMRLLYFMLNEPDKLKAVTHLQIKGMHATWPPHYFWDRFPNLSYLNYDFSYVLRFPATPYYMPPSAALDICLEKSSHYFSDTLECQQILPLRLLAYQQAIIKKQQTKLKEVIKSKFPKNNMLSTKNIVNTQVLSSLFQKLSVPNHEQAAKQVELLFKNNITGDELAAISRILFGMPVRSHIGALFLLQEYFMEHLTKGVGQNASKDNYSKIKQAKNKIFGKSDKKDGLSAQEFHVIFHRHLLPEIHRFLEEGNVQTGLLNRWPQKKKIIMASNQSDTLDLTKLTSLDIVHLLNDPDFSQKKMAHIRRINIKNAYALYLPPAFLKRFPIHTCYVGASQLYRIYIDINDYQTRCNLQHLRLDWVPYQISATLVDARNGSDQSIQLGRKQNNFKPEGITAVFRNLQSIKYRQGTKDTIHSWPSQKMSSSTELLRQQLWRHEIHNNALKELLNTSIYPEVFFFLQQKPTEKRQRNGQQLLMELFPHFSHILGDEQDADNIVIFLLYTLLLKKDQQSVHLTSYASQKQAIKGMLYPTAAYASCYWIFLRKLWQAPILDIMMPIRTDPVLLYLFLKDMNPDSDSHLHYTITDQQWNRLLGQAKKSVVLPELRQLPGVRVLNEEDNTYTIPVNKEKRHALKKQVKKIFTRDTFVKAQLKGLLDNPTQYTQQVVDRRQQKAVKTWKDGQSYDKDDEEISLNLSFYWKNKPIDLCAQEMARALAYFSLDDEDEEDIITNTINAYYPDEINKSAWKKMVLKKLIEYQQETWDDKIKRKWPEYILLRDTLYAYTQRFQATNQEDLRTVNLTHVAPTQNQIGMTLNDIDLLLIMRMLTSPEQLLLTDNDISTIFLEASASTRLSRLILDGNPIDTLFIPKLQNMTDVSIQRRKSSYKLHVLFTDDQGNIYFDHALAPIQPSSAHVQTFPPQLLYDKNPLLRVSNQAFPQTAAFHNMHSPTISPAVSMSPENSVNQSDQRAPAISTNNNIEIQGISYSFFPVNPARRPQRIPRPLPESSYITQSFKRALGWHKKPIKIKEKKLDTLAHNDPDTLFMEVSFTHHSHPINVDMNHPFHPLIGTEYIQNQLKNNPDFTPHDSPFLTEMITHVMGGLMAGKPSMQALKKKLLSYYGYADNESIQDVLEYRAPLYVLDSIIANYDILSSLIPQQNKNGMDWPTFYTNIRPHVKRQLAYMAQMDSAILSHLKTRLSV